MDSSDSPTEELLDTSLESSPSSELGVGRDISRSPHRPSPFTLRSQCGNDRCPMGAGILFRSRISPSPSKTVWGRRRRRSDQSHLDTTTSSGNTTYLHDLSHDSSHIHDHHNHSHDHHNHSHDHHNHSQHLHGPRTTQVYRVHAHYNRNSIHAHHDSLAGGGKDDSTLPAHPEHTHTHTNQTDHTHSIQGHHTHATQNQTDRRHRSTHQTHSYETRRTHSPHHTHSYDTRRRTHSPHHTHSYQTRRTHSPHAHTHHVHENREVRKRRVESPPSRPQPLQAGEMVRHRSKTPKTKKKASTPTKSKDPGSDGGNTSAGMNSGVAALAQAVKRNVLDFLTPIKDKNTSLPSIVESSESGFEEGNLFGDTVATSSPASDQFVGARQFFQEHDTRERLSSDYFSGTDTPSKIRASTHRLSIRKPFNQYIAYSSDEELDDWRQQPKSDYTYSASLTYRERVTPDRKIGSPNMSRRGLRGGGSGSGSGSGRYSGSREFSTTTTTTDLLDDTDTTHLELRTRSILRPMDALSDTSDGEEVVEIAAPVRRLRSSRSRSVDVSPMSMSNGSTVTRTHTSSSYTTTKTLHRGLDVDSDADDGSESTVPLRATPLTRGTTPLARAPTPLGRASTSLERAGTPLGRASTPLGRAVTPLGRSVTPLGRSVTPINASLRTSSLDTARGGYTLAKGAIAEDVEEEEEMDEPKNCVVAWSRKTWQQVTWITTVVTSSIVMMAARAVTARRQDTSDAPLTDGIMAADQKKSRSSSFMSSVTLTTKRVTTSTSEFFASTREKLRRNPLWLWIPLLFLLLLLALVAYWWLLQSRAKTDDDTATDLTDEPSFLSLALTSASDLTLSVTNGISGTAHSAAVGMTSWLVSAATWVVAACSAVLNYAWVLVAGMFSWLGSAVHDSLSHLLHFLYLTIDLLQYLFWALLGFFTTSVSYVLGIFLPVAGNTTTTQAIHTETWDASATVQSETQETHSKTWDATATVQSETQETHSETWDATATTHETRSETWSIRGWVSNAASLNWASDTYSSLSEGAKSTQSRVWSGWMWLVLSVGESLSFVATSILWLLNSIGSLAYYLLSGLWNGLAYIFTGILGFFTSAATTVTSLAVETSTTVASNAKLMFLYLFTSSTKDKSDTIYLKSSTSGSVNIQGTSVDEVVQRVLSSDELKVLIASVAAESSSKGQLTRDDVSNIVRSVVEGEVGSFRAEVSTLRGEVELGTKATGEETTKHIQTLRTQQEYLLQQLDVVGAGLSKLEGSMSSDQKTNTDQHSQYQEQLVQLRTQIELLTAQLKDLESNHSNLAVEVRRCCQNATVSLADVERHVATLLADVFGLGGGDSNGEGGGVKAEDLSAWLKSYFVAKDELESRLSAIVATMHVTTAATSDERSQAGLVSQAAAVEETTRVVMDSVLERLREELHTHHQSLTQQMEAQVSQQVNQQVEAAAMILTKEMNIQLETELLSSKQKLQDTIMVTLDNKLPGQVDAKLSQLIAAAVSEAVSAQLPGVLATELPVKVAAAVNDAVEPAVELRLAAAVSEEVHKTLPGAVNLTVTRIVGEIVPQTVEQRVQEAVVLAIRESVMPEVEAAVGATVVKVVASELPAAVNVSMKDSVSTAVSEALVHLRASNKAGDNLHMVSDNGEEGVVVAAGSSSSSSNKVSATVNISRNSSSSSTNGAGLFALGAGLNESAVVQIVKEALLKYDADRTGMVDHALESAGGNIISTRCTESYQVHQAQVSILGVPFYWYSTNNPRTIIQPDRMPGQCWAFKGSQGYIVVQLAGPVKPTGFTLEHIPKSLSPSGEIDSAPREIEVWGLHSENDEGTHFGTYEYSQHGEPLQYFHVMNANDEYFPLIELKINSNHGNLQYTCLYRFRVHGLRYF